MQGNAIRTQGKTQGNTSNTGPDFVAKLSRVARGLDGDFVIGIEAEAKRPQGAGR